jgi:hypothetical protein
MGICGVSDVSETVSVARIVFTACLTSSFEGRLEGALNSDDGVQAHTKMKAKTNTKEPTLCFTAAKLHIFEELKELWELKGVKRQEFLRFIQTI